MLSNVLVPLVDGRTRTQGAKGTQFATSARPNHWGTDLRASVYNEPGDNIHAPCKMTLISAGIGDGTENATIPWHSGRFQYWDLGVWGGDRMYLYFGHLHAHVGGTAYGRTVKAGTHVAEMGGSGAGGADKFVDHLHIGVAQNTTRPTGLLRNGKGWIDPVKWFAKHGVNFNSSPIAPTFNLATSTPAAPTPKGGLTVSDIKTITEKLDRLEGLISNSDKNSHGRRTAILDALDGVPAAVWEHKIGTGSRAQDYLYGARMAQYTAREQARTQLQAIQSVADKPGATVEEIQKALANAVVTVDVNVKEN